MIQREMVLVAASLLLGSGFALAQAQPQAPQPGPEQKKLGYFVGTWTNEGEMKPNPFMPGGKFSGTDRCEWFEGGFTVVCRSEGTGPMGPTKGLGIMGYNSEEQVYTYYGVDNSPMTMASVPRGKVTGDTWVYDDEAKMGGKTVRSRFVMQQLSATSYTFKWEMVGEDGAWTTVMEGKSTKQP
jgi:hypothetical protein